MWFDRRLRSLKYGQACESVRKFIDDSLSDRLGGDKPRSSASYASWIAGGVYLIASKCGWDYERIFNMPIGVMFQMQRMIVADSGNRAALSNRSDRIKGEFLASCRERMKGKPA
jgi:hypothetical protein